MQLQITLFTSAV